MGLSRLANESSVSMVRAARSLRYLSIHRKYSKYTMVPRPEFWRNLQLVDDHRHVQGCVVECGVWRGGMSAGIAEVLGPSREYFLFDSFQGLPPAQEIDGRSALEWQKNVEDPAYYDNCSAERAFAEKAMQMSPAVNYRITEGWFAQTLPTFVPPSPIAILRLDGDWYESTMTALETLFQHVAKGGIVIIDDYHTWDGCCLAVHDFLSRIRSTTRIRQKYGICILEPE